MCKAWLVNESQMWLEIVLASQSTYRAGAFPKTLTADLFRLLLRELHVHGSRYWQIFWHQGPINTKQLNLLTAFLHFSCPSHKFSLCSSVPAVSSVEDEASVLLIKCVPLITILGMVASQNCPLVSPTSITVKHGLTPTTKQSRRAFNWRRHVSQFSLLHSLFCKEKWGFEVLWLRGLFYSFQFCLVLQIQIWYIHFFLFLTGCLSPSNLVFKSIGAMQNHGIHECKIILPKKIFRKKFYFS